MTLNRETIHKLFQERGISQELEDLFIAWFEIKCDVCEKASVCELTENGLCSSKQRIIERWNEYIVDWKDIIENGGT